MQTTRKRKNSCGRETLAVGHAESDARKWADHTRPSKGAAHARIMHSRLAEPEAMASAVCH
jgi:hypothetical protein